jgi:hypothetical protein
VKDKGSRPCKGRREAVTIIEIRHEKARERLSWKREIALAGKSGDELFFRIWK